MGITSLPFIFVFLPIILIVYYLINIKLRVYYLIFASLLFYAIDAPNYILLLLISVIINLGFGLLIDYFLSKRNISKVFLIIGIIYNCSLLIYYKYSDFFLFNLLRIFNKTYEIKRMILPLGLSFFVFKAIAYLIDIYKQKISVRGNIVYSVVYLTFFPQVLQGPITRFDQMGFGGEIKSFKDGLSFFSSGIYDFTIGLGKKVILSGILFNIYQDIFTTNIFALSTISIWFGAFCYGLYIFYDFAGYSDMAIGLSKMFGYKCPQNFNYPYMTSSVSEFWRRWHISLGSWFRDYVYIPLGGSHVNKTSRLCFNLFVVWVLTGLWHGANWTFIVWGFDFFLLIFIEKVLGVPDSLPNCILKLFYRCFSIIFIMIQWVIFQAVNLKNGLSFIARMFIYNNVALSNKHLLFLVNDNLVFLVLSVLFCFPIVNCIEDRMAKTKALNILWNISIIVITFFIFLYSISFIVAGRNNPFAYANF